MNRTNYFNYIEEKLNVLSYRIKVRGKINLLDLNIYSETFFADLYNLLLDYNLRNINVIKQNTEGIDLIDDKRKIIVQVSSTCSKHKIENSLNKNTLSQYSDFRFKFIAITGNGEKLRSTIFKNPYGITFLPNEDIYDMKSLLNIILNLPIDKQRKVYIFLKSELGSDIDITRVDTNLASIINILSKENLVDDIDLPEINAFEILRKIEFNELSAVQPIIDEYKIYYSRIDEKYKEFDRQGANKSLSVLSLLKTQYIKLSSSINDSCELFFAIIDYVIELIKNSNNYIEIPYDELEMCVSMLIVDAFIRCKIFKNPEGYNYVATR